MPGKYSHSAVLADYSSRGIISLPNEEHYAFLKSSHYSASTRSRQNSTTWSEEPPAPQPRSRSALAVTNRSYPESGRVSAAGRRVIIDRDLDTEEDGVVKSDFRPNYQRPATSQTVRNLPNRGRELALKHIQESSRSKTQTIPTSDHAAFLSVSKFDGAQPRSPQLTDNRTNRLRAEEFLRQNPVPPTRAPQNATASSSSASQPSNTNKALPKLEPAAEIRSSPNASIPARKGSIPQSQSLKPPRKPENLQHRAIYEPQTSVAQQTATEPDFGGFSDAEPQADSYFEKGPEPRMAKPQNVVSVSQRPARPGGTSPRILPARNTESRATTHRSVSTEPPETLNVVGTGTSPSQSQGLRSLTSMSTTSSKGVPLVTRVNKTGETKKSAPEQSNQNWKLPEIDEDGTFGPDFFTQGPEDIIPRNGSDGSIDSFLNRPLGTVSAGRDIDFSKDNDDDSEADAACPPDIGRFRMDEELLESSFLQSTRTNDMIGKTTSAAQRPSQGKMTGFFSRLRTKGKSKS